MFVCVFSSYKSCITADMDQFQTNCNRDTNCLYPWDTRLLLTINETWGASERNYPGNIWHVRAEHLSQLQKPALMWVGISEGFYFLDEKFCTCLQDILSRGLKQKIP